MHLSLFVEPITIVDFNEFSILKINFQGGDKALSDYANFSQTLWLWNGKLMQFGLIGNAIKIREEFVECLVNWGSCVEVEIAGKSFWRSFLSSLFRISRQKSDQKLQIGNFDVLKSNIVLNN